MRFESEQRRLGDRSRGSQLQAFVGKALAAVVASVVLVGAIAMSLVLFVIALAVVLVGGLFVWWKVRQLRKAAEARFEEYQQHAQRDDVEGNIIEGVVIREVHISDVPDTKR